MNMARRAGAGDRCSPPASRRQDRQLVRQRRRGGGTDAGASSPTIGVDCPRADSDFWNSYAKYIPQFAQETGIDLMTHQLAERHRQAGRQRADADQPGRQGDRDGAAGHRRHRVRRWSTLATKKIPVVTSTPAPTRARCSWSCAPTTGPTAQKACEFLGEKLERQGQGHRVPGLALLGQRPRPLRGVQRVHEDELPGHHGLRRADRVGGRQAPRRAADPLTSNPDIKGIYMQAGGVFLAARCSCSSRRTCSSPPDDPKHIFIVSNDGIPQEFEAIRRARSTPPSRSRPTCTPSTRSSTPRRRSRARRSSPARPTTTAPSSTSATAARGPAPRSAGHPTAATSATERA